jgi:chitodextrinase
MVYELTNRYALGKHTTMRKTTLSLIILVLFIGNFTPAPGGQAGLHGPPSSIPSITNERRTDLTSFAVNCTVTFSEKDISFRTMNGFTTVALQDCAYLDDPGKPMLPMKNIRIALPLDMKVTSLKIIDEVLQPIKGTYTVYPAQKPLPLGTPFDGSRFIQPDAQTYASDQPYPQSPAEYAGQCDLAGQAMADVRIYPISCVPAENRLNLVSSVTFSLIGTSGYVCGDYLPDKISNTDRAMYQQIVQHMVINPENVNLRATSGPQPLGLAPGNYSYVIITKDSWASAFQPLADWKTQKGVPATIVNTSWIYNNGGYSGTNVQKIRSFVQDAYNTWGTTYVLLGGDIDTVPCNYKTILSDSVPNDAYYADFDGDYVCEVNIGRASVNNTGNGTGGIGNFINKVLTYETSPPLTNYAKDAGFFGFDLDINTHAELCKKNINSSYIPAGWTVTTVYDSQTGNHRTNVLNALNAGQNIVNHADHSGSDCMGTGYFHNNAWLIYSSDMDSLTNGNKQTILYSMGCDPAAYDVPICIAEHFVRNKNGGGIAFIGNSRYGWYNYGTYDTLSMGYDIHFFKSLFQENFSNLGAAFSVHKNEAYQDDPTDDYYKYIFTELTLLGDPELPVWTQNPTNLSVTHPSSLPLGNSSFYVKVSSGGSAVNQAYVCLWKGNEVYQRGYTNATGNITFIVAPFIAGSMKVTVTKHNFLPNVSTAEVTGENLPPYQPSAPTPTNNATTISVSTNLSWSGGDPNQGDIVTYDVYFGTSSNPPRVVNNQSGTTYDPGTLAYVTTYHWKIVAWDNHGASTAGPAWNFTTKANTPPVYGNPSPSNGSTGNPLHFTWSIPISDPDQDSFSWTIQCSNAQASNGTGGSNGTKSLTLSGLAYATSYKVWVNATDPNGSGLYTRTWYTFTTKISLPPIFGAPNTSNRSTNASLAFTWSIPISDPEGDLFFWTIQCSNGQNDDKIQEVNGTKTLALFGLAYDTTYRIWVNATDQTGSNNYTSAWFTFTTKANQPPAFGSPTPANGSTNNPLSFTWGILLNDTEGDHFNWTIDCSDGQTNSAMNESNGTKSLTLTNLHYKTAYTIWVNATDSSGNGTFTRAWYTFTTRDAPVNIPPRLVSPSPANGSTNVPLGTSSLSITIQDPEGDRFNWTITTAPNIGSSSGTNASNGTKTANVSGLAYSTMYTWTVQAYDGHHWTNHSFSFTTMSYPGGGDGGGSPQPPANHPPIANLSAGEPYHGDVNTSIIFDGSKSTAPDGTITTWFWVFGDHTSGTGKIVEHVYAKAGTYTVTLTVTDDKGTTNTATTTCVITRPNRPPTTPRITGPMQGTKNTQYDYTVVSNDADNDTLRYYLIWGDQTSYENTSSFLPSGTLFTCGHRWTTPGIYTITVHASDNKTDSEPAYLIVLIDVNFVGNLGYLIDRDGAGAYNRFHSNSTMNETVVQREANGTYLIDSNGDSVWEYRYNVTTGVLLLYHAGTGKGIPDLDLPLVICAVTLILFLNRKRKR